MRRIESGGKFRKDLKRYMNKPQKLKKLYEILRLLQSGEPIPKEYKPHELVGDYKGHWGRHIDGDFLLIWIDENEELIRLVRLGSHSELFGKRKR